MDLEVPKCVITGCPNKSKTKPETFKAKIQAQNINYKNQQIPILHQNEPYVYLDILLVFHPYERNPEQVWMPAPVGPFFWPSPFWPLDDFFGFFFAKFGFYGPKLL